MKYLVDIDDLERQGVLKPEVAAKLREQAGRDVVSTAIGVVLGFGAIAVAAGLVATFAALLDSRFASSLLASGVGAGFLAAALAVRRTAPGTLGRLADVWMVVGALTLSVSVGFLIGRPLWSSLAAAAILLSVAVLARSHLLVALGPLALAAAIGASAGYWEACYMIAVREPTLTIALFSALGVAAWQVVQRLPGPMADLALTFARMCVVVVNFGFWVGSLWGDDPGALWRHPEGFEPANPQIPAVVFSAAWVAAAVAAGWWGARNGRRFMVNAAATFGAINFYTQWFVRLGASPLTVLAGGAVAIAIGSALLRYNAQVREARQEPSGNGKPVRAQTEVRTGDGGRI